MRAKIIYSPIGMRPVAPPHFLHDSERGGVFKNYLITEKIMTREEFDTTRWYKGIKIIELGPQRVSEVERIDFDLRTVMFWDGIRYRELDCELVDIVEDE